MFLPLTVYRRSAGKCVRSRGRGHTRADICAQRKHVWSLLPLQSPSVPSPHVFPACLPLSTEPDWLPNLTALDGTARVNDLSVIK